MLRTPRFVIALSVLFALTFASQAWANRINPRLNDDRDDDDGFFAVSRGHEDSVRHEREDDDSRHATMHVSRVRQHTADSEAYKRKLTFKLRHDDDHVTPPSTVGNPAGDFTSGNGDPATQPSDPATTVPEPSSLLLMSAGLVGVGMLLRNRMGAKTGLHHDRLS
jgi:hypothetical protein